MKTPLIQSLLRRIIADSVREAKNAFSKKERLYERKVWDQLFRIYEYERKETTTNDNTIRRERASKSKDC